jgi:chromosomal replication initiation ATPase DnaA
MPSGEVCWIFSRMRIAYTSGERFMNEMVNCIKLDVYLCFTSTTASGVLLVDDVLFAGKERTQEEFFHISTSSTTTKSRL